MDLASQFSSQGKEVTLLEWSGSGRVSGRFARAIQVEPRKSVDEVCRSRKAETCWNAVERPVVLLSSIA